MSFFLSSPLICYGVVNRVMGNLYGLDHIIIINPKPILLTENSNCTCCQIMPQLFPLHLNSDYLVGPIGPSIYFSCFSPLCPTLLELFPLMLLPFSIHLGSIIIPYSPINRCSPTSSTSILSPTATLPSFNGVTCIPKHACLLPSSIIL